VHDVSKVPAKRAPKIGEHNEEILKELQFDTKEIERLRATGVIGTSVALAKAA
jgi:formyl-CoA transferase